MDILFGMLPTWNIRMWQALPVVVALGVLTWGTAALRIRAQAARLPGADGLVADARSYFRIWMWGIVIMSTVALYAMATSASMFWYVAHHFPTINFR